ncbi:MAG: hypothetical protein QNJ16_18340 [Rhodobacter sp.]|nr:hypothetical protein [Rhodobacter sp.]
MTNRVDPEASPDKVSLFEGIVDRLKDEGYFTELEGSGEGVDDAGYDEISNPAHYTAGRSIEPWDVADDWDLGRYYYAAMGYIARAGRKGDRIEDELRDARKAIAHLERQCFVLERAMARRDGF